MLGVSPGHWQTFPPLSPAVFGPRSVTHQAETFVTRPLITSVADPNPELQPRVASGQMNTLEL